jgi:hypothetical protein
MLPRCIGYLQFNRLADRLIAEFDFAAHLEIGLFVQAFKKPLAKSGIIESQKYTNHKASSVTNSKSDTGATRTF